jgi:hypothetical protein
VTHAHLHVYSLSAFAAAIAARVRGIGMFDGRPTQRGGAQQSLPPWAMPSNGRRRITSYKQ